MSEDESNSTDATARISSYSTIWNIDHRQMEDLFSSPVVIQEKLDGSQFSAGVLDGELVFRSRKALVQAGSAPDLFRPAVAAFIELFEQGKLVNGWVYRGEAICKPRHNTIDYKVAPPNGFVLFDVETQPGAFLSPGMMRSTATSLGFHAVRTLGEGVYSRDMVVEEIPEWLALGSALNKDVEPEGIVVKNYNLYTPDKKVAMGKFVTAAFKEKHKISWRQGNPTRSDVVVGLVTQLRLEARWRKALQHGIESGILDANTRSMRDLAYLAKEIPADILRDEEEYIKQTLFDAFRGEVLRGAMKGLPEWYRANYVPAPTMEAAAVA